MNVLVVNAGSSSLKYQLFDTETNTVFSKGICERIGGEGSLIDHKQLVKDLRVKKEVPMPNFSSVGSGGIAVHALLETCYDMGIEYAICEQDFMHVLTPLEVLQTNYLVMKETGFLE